MYKIIISILIILMGYAGIQVIAVEKKINDEERQQEGREITIPNPYKMVIELMHKDATDTVYYNFDTLYTNEILFRCYELDRTRHGTGMSFSMYDILPSGKIMLKHTQLYFAHKVDKYSERNDVQGLPTSGTLIKDGDLMKIFFIRQFTDDGKYDSELYYNIIFKRAKPKEIKMKKVKKKN